jgi:NAD(P)-dependent dehydrogenase (short-subunit alcohol dehydrogenase family)
VSNDSLPRVALVTGGSRGIGAATALALAVRGIDVAITYRNKAARAEEVAREIIRHNQRALWIGCDITRAEDRERLFAQLGAWRDHLDVLVLNASGGLERDLVAADHAYPMRINRDAQLAVVERALPHMPAGASIIFITSHWAHLYGQVEQLATYEPVAASKYAGEQALRRHQEMLAAAGIRLLVITGDLIEGTITPRLLERASPGLAGQRRSALGRLPTADEMGEAIASAATDPALPSGETIVVGGALDSFLR